MLVSLVITVVLLGLRGGFALHGWRGRYHHDGVPIAVALEVFLAALLVVVIVRGRRSRGAPADMLAARLRAALRPLLAGGLIVIPVVLLLSAPLHGHVVLPRRPHSLQPTSQPVPSFRSQPPAVARSFHVPLTDVLYAVLGVVLLAGIAACVIALRRRTEAEAAPPAGDASLADGQRAGLRDAVESGRRALVQLDDARAAIIACYLAMEGSLAAAGAARTRADTPGEFLARAVADGLVHGAAAGQLTSLFYEARFSGHEMTGAQRGAAEVALRQLAADLSEAPAGTAPAAGTAPGVPAPGEAASSGGTSSGGTSSGNASGRAGDQP